MRRTFSQVAAQRKSPPGERLSRKVALCLRSLAYAHSFDVDGPGFVGVQSDSGSLRQVGTDCFRISEFQAVEGVEREQFVVAGSQAWEVEVCSWRELRGLRVHQRCLIRKKDQVTSGR